ncbi:MAG: saccharopine dehydrogenase-like oxidoreductase [Candidatus Melainabacteria bacterium]
MTARIRLAVFGFGGLGKGMIQVAECRPDFQVVAVADRQGWCFNAGGFNTGELLASTTTLKYPEATASEDALIDLLKAHGDDIDGIFMALPNLPVEFFHDTLKRILDETGFRGVFVDALKRTEAVERLMALSENVRHNKCLYVTGAGATPGFLTTIAAVAAHSFVSIENVDIHFGVGVSNWDQYKATIREDLIHLEGFDAKRVACMTNEEIARELEARNGLLELNDMEHADDVILEMAGVCSRDKVHVGGLVDTRNAKKPVSTTVSVTGTTASGKTGTHQFIVSDEASMVDNVCGPALGYMLRAQDMWDRGLFGILTSADVMPKFGQPVAVATQKKPHLTVV